MVEADRHGWNLRGPKEIAGGRRIRFAVEAARTRRSGWVTLVGAMFLIAGGFNLVWGLVALGVSLGGTDHTVLGDLSVHNLEGLGAVGVIVGLIELYAGAGILQRRAGAQILGLVLAGLVVLLNFAYYRVLDGWAFTGLAWNLIIIFILALRSEEFA